ncbi:MAG: SRPBCC domain-containing protein [Rhodocyclaceae bacterium]
MPSRSEHDRVFVLTREFDAPPERVFRAWTEPHQLSRWWGPHDFSNPVCEIDERPGGAYRIVMRSPEGEDYPIRGRFIDIEPGRRLVMTMDCAEHPPAWHDAIDPQRGDTLNPAGVMTNTVTFEDLGGRTRLTIRIEFDRAAMRAALEDRGMREGWTESFDRLSTLMGPAT